MIKKFALKNNWTKFVSPRHGQKCEFKTYKYWNIIIHDKIYWAVYCVKKWKKIKKEISLRIGLKIDFES